MRFVSGNKVVTMCVALIGCAVFLGCNARDQREADERARQEARNAAEKAKPVLQEAGRELKDAASQAAEGAHSIAQGAKEGWDKAGQKSVDINSASEAELTNLPGITQREARGIIANRPYKDTRELVDRRILTEDDYAKVKGLVVAR